VIPVGPEELRASILAGGVRKPSSMGMQGFGEALLPRRGRICGPAGAGSLIINSISITGPQAADFSETNTCGRIPATLAAGASRTITVVFKPHTERWARATLVITDNSNGVAGSTQTVDLIRRLGELRTIINSASSSP
jgi:hypothetical protein